MNRNDRKRLKHLYNNSGYVLEFSNKSFANFILETLDFDPYEKYENQSKGKLLEKIISDIDNKDCMLLANRLLEEAKLEYERMEDSQFHLFDIEEKSPKMKEYESIIIKTEDILRKYDNNLDLKIDIDLNSDKYTNMYDLRESVDTHFDKGLYDQAVDRVHTLFHSYLDQQCQNLGLDSYSNQGSRKPLDNLFNIIVNELCRKKLIKSDLTKSILQNSKNIFKNFNDARNNESAAHPAENWLHKDEAYYVIITIINTIKLLDNVIKG